MSTTATSPGPYPVGYEVDFVEQRSRLTTFFRYFMVIPLMIVGIFYVFGMYLAALGAWFGLMFTGRYPAGLYRFNSRVVRWASRVTAYYDLLTDQYPPFDLEEHPEYPVRVPIAPPQESYSRLKVFFRFLLGIPVMLIWWALGAVAAVCAFISWFWIVFTGKQNEGLQNAIVLGTAYNARATAYFVYLTEDWPPFSPEGGSALGPAQTTGALPESPPAAAPVAPEAPASTEAAPPPDAPPPGTA